MLSDNGYGDGVTMGAMTDFESRYVSTGSAIPGSETMAHERGHATASRAMLEMHVLMNGELRSQMDRLRRDMERIREERAAVATSSETDLNLPPPQYSDNPELSFR